MPETASSKSLLNDLVLDLAEKEAWSEVAQALAGQHPADIAEVIRHASREWREHIFDAVEDSVKPDVLSHLEGTAEAEVLQSLTSEEISDLVEEMAPDDAADVIADLTEERSEEVLGMMETEEQEEVRELLKYDEESAGGIMTSDVLSFCESLPVEEALATIADQEDDEPVYNAYIVDPSGKLTGYIELWEMIKVRDKHLPLKEVAHADLIVAKTDEDQEDVAHRMAKYDLTAIPVVDEAGQLVGRITVDDVVDVISDEASEDIFRLAGSDDAELSYTSAWRASRIRLPWLMITLTFTFASSLIMKRFMLNLTVTDVIALSFFVPIVMAMSGSTGMQSSTLIIRSMALRSLEGVGPFKLLRREIATGLLIALVCSLLLMAWARLVVSHSAHNATAFPPTFLAFIAGSALFMAITFAAAYGAFVPILLDKLHLDPAVASGPFVTASNDIISLGIYYGTTVAMLHLFSQVGGAGL